MKIRALLLLLLSSPVIATAAVPELFFEGTWEEARKKAKKENKYIFLDCWTEWCGYCKMMDNETFIDSSVVDFMHGKFVSLSRDVERGEGRLLNMKYHTVGYPTYLIFNPKGQLCAELIGYFKPQDFIDTLKVILKPESQHACTGFSDELDPGYPEFYHRAFGSAGNREFADSTVVIAWLDKQPDWSTEVCWSVIWRFSGGRKHSQWVFDNRDTLYQLYGEQVWQWIGRRLAYYGGYLAAVDSSDTMFRNALKMAKQYLPEPYYSECIYYTSTYFYETTGQWTNYAAVNDVDFRKNNFNNPVHINNVSWKLYEESTDSTTLAMATGWMEIVISRDSSWEYVDTYATLLMKTGRYREAEVQALKAIEIGGKSGEVMTTTRELLDKIREHLKR